MVGIFDSGVGGMTVARAVEQLLPGHRQIYFGDLARTPYGSKSPETIQAYSQQNMDFLVAQGATAVIIACNSAASVASDTLRHNFSVPIFEVITPAVEKVVRTTRNGRIGVIGTRATIRSGIYERKIRHLLPEAQVFSVACPLLVPLVEEGWQDRRETKMILRRYLAPLKKQQVDTLVLGCTHYPLLKKLIQPRVGKRVTIIDSSEEVAASYEEFLNGNGQDAHQSSGPADNVYYVSDVTAAAQETADRIFGRKIPLIKVRAGQ